MRFLGRTRRLIRPSVACLKWFYGEAVVAGIALSGRASARGPTVVPRKRTYDDQPSPPQVVDVGETLISLNLLDLDPVRIRYLEQLHDHEQAHPGEAMESAPFLIEECGLSQIAALQLTRALDALGLVNECNGLADPAAWLADGGREAVKKIRAYRSNPANRAAAARTAALAHSYEARLNGIAHLDAAGAASCTQGHGEFLGAPLTRDEILAAVDYLEQKCLLTVSIRNAGGVAQGVSITASGEDCMEQHEGDVSNYLQQQRQPATTYNHIGSITGGSGIQIGNTQATQHVNVGLDPVALRELVAMLRPQLGQFGDAEPEAESALDEVAEEAGSAHPNQRRIVTALTKVAEMAVPASARLAVEFLRYRLQEWGVLPPPSGSLPPAP